MKILIPLLTLMLLSSCRQEKDLDIEKYMSDGYNKDIVKSFIDAGNKDFFFVSRIHTGLYFGKPDSCKVDTFIKFMMVKAQEENKYEFIKYDNCGQSRTLTDSKSLLFFEENRGQIKKDSIEETVFIDHSVFYSLYEFRDGGLKTYKRFCKECVDVDRDESTKSRNQSLKMYQFFKMLDTELTELIK